MHNGVGQKIRLHGIDCPEKRQAFGNRAKQFASALVFGKTVAVQDHSRDRYGWTIGDVILPDGRRVNRELVKAGMCWWYRKYAPNDKQLAQRRVLPRDPTMKEFLPGNEHRHVPTLQMRIDPRGHLLASCQNVVLSIVCLLDSLLGVRVGGSLWV